MLTRREQQVAGLAAKGMTNDEIAKKLSIAEGTTKAHLHNIYVKLGVRDRTALALHYLDHRRRLRR